MSYREIVLYPSSQVIYQCSLILDIGVRTRHPSGILWQKWSAFFKYLLTFHYILKNLWIHSLELWECNNINPRELEFKVNLRNLSSFQHNSKITSQVSSHWNHWLSIFSFFFLSFFPPTFQSPPISHQSREPAPNTRLAARHPEITSSSPSPQSV